MFEVWTKTTINESGKFCKSPNLFYIINILNLQENIPDDCKCNVEFLFDTQLGRQY